MDLISIGEAAARLGLAASALRYYDERGLVRPSGRRGGKRMYGPEQLRRLAFVKLAQSLGLSLETAAAVLDAPGPQWRELLDRQVEELDEIIARARLAQRFLTHARNCPAEHPAQECPTMTAGLDQLLAGTPITDLLTENG
ncbi:MerR family transcriptional regulator [Nocardia sp. CDC159]|uniref:MerR family transcriptional regulator n=1 Tax=Nocardia pulmonis TaxID=2951408 RepID=A0A9X2E9Q6_9NOCA|nr:MULTISPECIES: MerR family transcriptional regulator [Nocardia]MCM6776286.1 MerR family transcriptional regulator [Nocardia pulmonis]MCM6788710.1 MerR family transcriptional regulator [Nocardia sp. CDC159]